MKDKDDTVANRGCDFFVSYNRADRTWAEWIAWHLEAAGYTVVIQDWDFRPGSNFVIDMQRAASTATRTIAVLSPDYIASRFTQPEWTAAFAQDPIGEKGKLLPIRVREVDLTGLLPQIVYIDLVGLDDATAQTTLLAGIQRSRAKPTVAPSFPGARIHQDQEQPQIPTTSATSAGKQRKQPRSWTPELTRLRTVLASLYPDETSARRVVAQAELNATMISWSSHPTNNWHAILTEAQKRTKLAALAEVALQEYRDNTDLLTAADPFYDTSALPPLTRS